MTQPPTTPSPELAEIAMKKAIDAAYPGRPIFILVDTEKGYAIHTNIGKGWMEMVRNFLANYAAILAAELTAWSKFPK